MAPRTRTSRGGAKPRPQTERTDFEEWLVGRNMTPRAARNVRNAWVCLCEVWTIEEIRRIDADELAREIPSVKKALARRAKISPVAGTCVTYTRWRRGKKYGLAWIDAVVGNPNQAPVVVTA